MSWGQMPPCYSMCLRHWYKPLCYDEYDDTEIIFLSSARMFVSGGNIRWCADDDLLHMPCKMFLIRGIPFYNTNVNCWWLYILKNVLAWCHFIHDWYSFLLPTEYTVRTLNHQPCLVNDYTFCAYIYTFF